MRPGMGQVGVCVRAINQSINQSIAIYKKMSVCKNAKRSWEISVGKVLAA